jgi:histidinol dehydrogenase
MEKVIYPAETSWEQLCLRNGEEGIDLREKVIEILGEVKTRKDEAVRYYTILFDKALLADFRVTQEEIANASSLVPEDLKKAIAVAKSNIEKFHLAQVAAEPVIETSEGVRCWRTNSPIEKVGLYIPGGTAPLFSTLLMLGIPAKIAGCREIVVCTPPQQDGSVNPVILFTAGLLGLTGIYKAGGVQAIGAMAYGTESIPKVYKIFGPGNSYVTMAKEIVQQEGVAIDMPAGPSEVLVIADNSADPSWVAADLLSQAEHGPDSQSILVTNSRKLLLETEAEIERQMQWLPRAAMIRQSLEHSRLILLSSLDECLKFSNMYAPEHLIINTENYASLAGEVRNAGSVFLGPYSCESMGDYASGTNHTLPTSGYARNYSGLSTESFMKKITFQEISSEGMKNLGPIVEIMADAESLSGHRNAVTFRLKKIKNGRS